MDEQLKNQFEVITRTILSNQTEALSNLTKKVEKEIGQVWRQMGIMYGQVSNSISILEKVKASTEGYVNNTSKNLGTMEGKKKTRALKSAKKVQKIREIIFHQKMCKKEQFDETTHLH